MPTRPLEVPKFTNTYQMERENGEKASLFLRHFGTQESRATAQLGSLNKLNQIGILIPLIAYYANMCLKCLLSFLLQDQLNTCVYGRRIFEAAQDKRLQLGKLR